MQLRRFTGENTPAALEAVRSALGGDAMILSNRRIGDRVEIIATGQYNEEAIRESVSDQSPVMPVSQSRQSAASTSNLQVGEGDRAELAHARPSGPINDEGNGPHSSFDSSQGMDAGDEQSRSIATGIASGSRDQTRIRLSDSGDRLELPAMRPEDVTGLAQPLPTFALHTGPNVDVVGDPVAEKPQSSQAHVERADSEAASIERESLEDLKAALAGGLEQIEQRFRSLEVNLWGVREPARAALLKQLITMGLGAGLAVRLAERVPPDLEPEQSLRHALVMLKSTLPIATRRDDAERPVTVLSGPAGSGKTTVLMKLATEHVKTAGQQSIVIISADDRRIGAYESMQAFGRLLGVPVVQAHSAEELDGLIEAFSHKECVLVDQPIEQARALFSKGSRGTARLADTHRVRHLLVLSAALQSSAYEALFAGMQGLRHWRCVLTHLDDCSRLGEAFSALIRHHVPIDSWSDSPVLRKPLEKAEASVMVATAVAMGRRAIRTADDDWQMALIQPCGLTAQHITSPSLTTDTEKPEC